MRFIKRQRDQRAHYAKRALEAFARPQRIIVGAPSFDFNPGDVTNQRIWALPSDCGTPGCEGWTEPTESETTK